MAQKLKNLKIVKVDFVEEGANPDAHIVLLKQKDAAPEAVEKEAASFSEALSMRYLDKIADDLQNAAVTLLAENPDKLPQTDDSTAQFINRFSAILMGYTDRGVLASGIWRGADTGPLHAGDTVQIQYSGLYNPVEKMSSGPLSI